MRRVAVVMLWSLLWGVSLAAAQERQEAAASNANGSPTTLADPVAPVAAASAAQPPDQHSWIDERRACEGCPPRSVGRALFQTTVVNVMYGLANLVRGQVTARVTPKTWWDNMEQGWVWDLDDFTVNQIGHPYQGNNYFNTGRANGLSFYESAAVTAFGSATWEYFGETNHASLNDFINTTLGGIALGEMFHRTAWLVRNTRATGRGRLWSEIGATALDPITGVNRFMRGTIARSRRSSTRAVISTPSTASARTTSCSADASTSCCQCEVRSAWVSQASTSIDGRSIRTRRAPASATTTRRCAPTSHGGCREPLDVHIAARCLPARACPGRGVRPGRPGTVEPASRRRPEPVDRGRRRVRDAARRLSDL